MEIKSIDTLEDEMDIPDHNGHRGRTKFNC